MTSSEWISSVLGLSPATQGRLLTSLLTVVLLWILRRALLKLVWRQSANPQTRYQWQKTSAYVVFAIGLLVVGRIWVEGFQFLATYLGLLSAGLAIALKDLVVNLAGWAFILWRRPFEVGDRIEVGAHRGDVIDLRIFQFTLLEVGNWVDADQSTGRVIHIPNGKVFSESLANYSKGFQFIWNEIPVLITFESNWEKAKQILKKVAAQRAQHLSDLAEQRLREASKKFLIFYPNLEPAVYPSVKDSGVLLTIRYLCEPRNRRGSAELIWEDILAEFAQCRDVDFAYPTQRFYSNTFEGKAGMKQDVAEDSSEKVRNEIVQDDK